MQYPVLIESEGGVYGVVFPDLPGCVSVGLTVHEALGRRGTCGSRLGRMH